jgi:hypothetical protein
MESDVPENFRRMSIGTPIGSPTRTYAARFDSVRLPLPQQLQDGTFEEASSNNSGPSSDGVPSSTTSSAEDDDVDLPANFKKLMMLRRNSDRLISSDDTGKYQ